MRLVLLLLLAAPAFSQIPVGKFTFERGTYMHETHPKLEQWTLRYGSDDELMDGADELLGVTIPDKHEVLIRRGLSHDAERETLIHELEHVAFGSYMACYYPLDCKYDEHTFIERVAPVTASIYRRNPQIVKYFLR